MHTKKYGRRLAAAALALGAMSVLAACGEGGDTKESAAQADAAPAFDEGATLSEAEATDVLEEATESLSTAHVAISLDAVEEGEAAAGRGEGDFQHEPLAFRVSGEVTDSSGVTDVELVTIEDEFYANMDGEWIKGGFAAMMTIMMPSPSIFIDSVAGAVADGATTYVGQESISGVETAHYTFPAGETDFGAEGSLVDVNIDSENQLVRMGMDAGDAGSVVYDFSDHGEPVKIEKPAGDVTDMSDMDFEDMDMG